MKDEQQVRDASLKTGSWS